MIFDKLYEANLHPCIVGGFVRSVGVNGKVHPTNRDIDISIESVTGEELNKILGCVRFSRSRYAIESLRTNDGIKVEFLKRGSMDIYEHVETFDFTICQVWVDAYNVLGQCVNAREDIEAKRLVPSPYFIAQQDCLYTVRRTLFRIQKYIKEGFNMSSENYLAVIGKYKKLHEKQHVSS